MWATYSGVMLITAFVLACAVNVVAGRGFVAGLVILQKVTPFILLAGLTFAATMVALRHWYPRASPIGRALMVAVLVAVVVMILLYS